MKTLSSILVCIAALLATVTPAFAASAAYKFMTVDIPVPGQPDQFAFPDDINDKSEILSNIRVNNLSEALIVDQLNLKKGEFKTATFSCTGIPFADTAAFSINNKGQIAGYCADAPSAPSKQYGFVRDKDGDHILLDFPGADGTAAFGISTNGKVTGQFYGPLRTDHGGALSYRFHCFIWDDAKYTQLDFPHENTYVNCSSINKRGQILGEYITVTLQNEYLEHGWFIYDNGNFILDFPLSLEHIGGPAIYLADINDDGQIVGQRWNGGPGWDGLFLYDDGKFYDIELPSEFAYADVRGMNNKGQFVGVYLIQVGIDPFYGWPIYESHGYIATPARPEFVANGKRKDVLREARPAEGIDPRAAIVALTKLSIERRWFTRDEFIRALPETAPETSLAAFR
jgi:hypothetical protein